MSRLHVASNFCLVLALLSLCESRAAEASSAPVTTGAEVMQRALVERVKKALVFLPGSSFEMGDWGNESGQIYDGFAEGNNRPVHRVILDGFSMMAYKVTYEDFDLFTDSVGEPRIDPNPSDAKHRQPKKPAGVNWHGAKAYCGWLAKISGLPFDLPTEAQWEYAARSGGKKVLFATDNGNIDKDRNFPWDVSDRRTPDVGSYPANPAGLYGMLDLNASEWVNDWYDPDYYKHTPALNPKGPDQGQPADAKHPEFGPAKVIRGHASPGNSPAFGGFVFSRAGHEPKEVRSKSRASAPGYSGVPSTQFRCAVQQATPVR